MEATRDIRIPSHLWDMMVDELRKRGEGCRESGAFLLSRKDDDEVVEIAYYDDLDSEALSYGGISLSAQGFLKLWAHAATEKLKVVADVHTHPGAIVRQSSIDKRNPMVSIRGHVAMILPHFAVYPIVDLSKVGIYEYQGNLKWRTCKKGQRICIVS